MTALAPARNCVVEASAGTGKTTRLVTRIIELIGGGAAIDRVVAVTFTNAAAGDMKVRLRQEIDRRLAGELPPGERARLLDALRNLEKGFIGTIHSFCASLLRQRPIEARLDPRFEELAELEAGRLFGRVFWSWLQERLAAGSPTLDRAMCRLAYMEDRGEDPAERLRDAALHLAEWRDMDAPWTRRPFAREAEIEKLLERLLPVADGWRALIDLKFAPRGLREAAVLAETVAVHRSAGCAAYDEYEAALARIGQKEAEPADFRFEKSGRPLHADFEAWRGFRAAACKFRVAADADFAAALRDELWQVVERYQAAKLRAGQVDFADLLVAARDLMQNDSVRAALQARFDHLLIDEFQDTDPLQVEVLLLLAAADAGERDWRKAAPAPGKLFLVGDPKQSIYRFRRADVELYRDVCRQVLEAGAAEEKRTSSHRSVRSIQRFVNAAFQAMPDYLPLCGGRDEVAGQPGVVALPVLPDGVKPEKTALVRHTPPVVAGFVEWLITKSGWQVWEKDERVAVQPRHICILFRRFRSETTGDYVRSFERRNIAHLLIGSKSLHGREEAGVIRNALAAIEWPRDEFGVYATLRGPLFAVTDYALARYQREYGRLNPLALPANASAGHEPVLYALETVARLHRSRNYDPLAVTIARLLRAARAHANFAFRPGGGRVLGNVSRLIDLARRFEATTATSFRSFVEFLETEAAAGEATEAPLLEQEGEGVRLMTVHKAKGLEFPVVILADPGANLVASDAGSRWVDRGRRLCAQTLLQCAPWDVVDHQERERRADTAEAWRVAYVAATRARDLLVVTTPGPDSGEGWLAPLQPALSSQGVHPFDAGVLAPGPQMFDGIEEATGAILQGGAEPGLSRYQAWKQERERTIAAGALPSAVVVAATEAAPEAGAAQLPVEILKVDAGVRIASSRRLGKLVHAVLQDADWAQPDTVEPAARAHGRRLRCADSEVQSAVAAARAALRHPALRLPAGAQVFRELPFVLRKGGELLEGTIDLAIRTEAEWTLIDFKIGRAGAAAYRRQLRIYAEALRAAADLPVRACLLEITGSQ